MILGVLLIIAAVAMFPFIFLTVGEVAQEADGVRKKFGKDFRMFYISLEEPIPPSAREYLEECSVTCCTISDFSLLLSDLDSMLSETRNVP